MITELRALFALVHFLLWFLTLLFVDKLLSVETLGTSLEVFCGSWSALHDVKRGYYSDSFFFNPHELTKIVLKSSTKFNGVNLKHLAHGTEPKNLFLFFSVTFNTGRD